MDISSYSSDILRGDGELGLFRAQSPDGAHSVLVLAPLVEQPDPAITMRIESEFVVAGEIASDWVVRPLGLDRTTAVPRLILEDQGGDPVPIGPVRPSGLGRFLRIAAGLAAAVCEIHRHGLIHKDIRPANLLADQAGRVQLTGLGLATRLPRERQALVPPETIAGMLAYVAPEQTGRMNRSVDARSDLYSVGVTLYEMLTGTLPFAAADPLELIHCHIARPPTPPGERTPGIPGQIETIVLKLLGKTAEERYQTAKGLEADLRRCLGEWEKAERISPFPLGAHDVPDRLLIPERLYGRDAEITVLVTAFDRVVNNGGMEVVLISGYSGIGKSSVVAELHKVLVPSRGLFAAGKFDQFKRDIPYATLAQAFQGLMLQIVGRGEAEVAGWRDALREALGANGQLMINLIPELERIVGPQPPVQTLPPQDAQNRFQLVFRRLLEVFARPEHPLTLFLDDLQWLDRATLDLIRHLVEGQETPHLLLVGAYRDNEVDGLHPLFRTIEGIREIGTHVSEIVLGPLAPEDVEHLLADTLRADPDRAAPLARLIHGKTGGNPFFAIQFISTLADEGLLGFDPKGRGWNWSLDRIRAKNLTDDIVDLMMTRLARLPRQQLDILKLLACLGNGAAVSTIGQVREPDSEPADKLLWELVNAGLIGRKDSAYAFVHDRIQEAAYALIPTAERPALHLGIGKALSAGLDAAEIEENVFEIVNQLNRGAALIEDASERERLAELNLTAGRRAKAATAYASGLTYLAMGGDLLEAGCWDRRYDLVFQIELNRAECEFLTGDMNAAEDRLNLLLSRTERLIDRAAATWLLVTLYTAQCQLGRAVETCLRYLKGIGVEWSAHPSRDDVMEEFRPIRDVIARGGIERLGVLPRLTDPEHRATLDVLTAVLPPAFFTDENLVCLVLCRAVNFSIANGNSSASSLAYAYLGMVLGPYFGDYRAGYQFGKLGYDLVRQHGLDRFKARVGMCFAYHVLPWTQPQRTGLPLLRQAYDTACEAGDVTYAGFCACTLISTLLGCGEPLGDVQREAERGLDSVRKAGFGLVADIITTQIRLIATLRGLTPRLGSFADAGFDEARFEAHLESDPSLTIAACWYWIRKLQACVCAGDAAAAVAAAARATPLMWTTGGHFEMAEYHFHAALAHAARYDGAPVADKPNYRTELDRHAAQLKVWAASSRENFGHRSALVEGEVARIDGRGVEALKLFESAARSARAGGFLQVEALAFETAARFCIATGLDLMADVHLRHALNAWRRLGAEGKVRQLLELHPCLRDEAMLWGSPAAPLGRVVEHLDLAAVVRTSQAISGETSLERLIGTLMVIALEHAGADRGLLILPHGGSLYVEAEARAGREAVSVDVRASALTSDLAPQSLLHTVIRTRDSLLLDDARGTHAFDSDDYFRHARCRSVLCVPLIKQSGLAGLLYLENSLTPYAFTPARIAVLKLLASQAAVSLENASLEEKETLLKEVHHRVKNNLQLISSLLSLQASRIEDPAVAELFADSRNRVRSMALVHENLYRAGDFARVSMKAHIQNLCSHLIRAYGAQSRNVDLVMHIEDLQMDMDRAVSCGLIINELVSNALKHAFPDDKAGHIEVALSLQHDRRCMLTVRDDGVGLHAGSTSSGSLGLQLVQDLTQQLRGTIAVTHDKGSSFSISFDVDGRR